MKPSPNNTLSIFASIDPESRMFRWSFSSDNFCYPVGNPVVFAFEQEEEALGKKIDLELEAVSMNPIPNFYEYWDVDASKELIELNHFSRPSYSQAVRSNESSIRRYEYKLYRCIL